MMLKVVLLAWLLCEGDLVGNTVVVPGGVVGRNEVYRERRGGGNDKYHGNGKQHA